MQQAARFVLARAISGRAHETSDISRTYLQQACAGFFSESLANLLAAIAHGQSTDEVACQTVRTLDVGASSGREGVLGCLLGLVTWAKPLPPATHHWFVEQTSLLEFVP